MDIKMISEKKVFIHLLEPDRMGLLEEHYLSE